MELEKNVLNSAEDKFDLLCICCAGVVRVDLLRSCTLIQGDEAIQEVVAGSVIIVPASVVREVVTQW